LTAFKKPEPTSHNEEPYGERRRERGRNPLDILIERESRTCKGCIFIMKSPLGGPEVACYKRRGKAKSSVAKTQRCDIYSPGEKA